MHLHLHPEFGIYGASYLELEGIIFELSDIRLIETFPSTMQWMLTCPKDFVGIKHSRDADEAKVYQCKFVQNDQVIDLSGVLTKWSCCYGVDNPTIKEQWCNLSAAGYQCCLTYHLPSGTLKPTCVEK